MFLKASSSRPGRIAGLVAVSVCVAAGVSHEGLAQQPSVPTRSAGVVRDMDYLKAAGGLASMPSPSWVQKKPIPLDVHFARERDLLRADAPYNKGHIHTRETPKGDLGVVFGAGDAIVTGTHGETWPITRKTFETTYSPIAGGRMETDGKFFKKPAPVLAVQMDEPFYGHGFVGTPGRNER
jgi:hypothetical protein